MIQKVLFTKNECEYILSLVDKSIGQSDIKNNDRDYSEWLIPAKFFNFTKDMFLQMGINSLPDGRIIKYNKGNYFGPHIDRYSNHPERYKTLIVQLNQDYDGGELMINNILGNKITGNSILFDSNDIHSVNEIKNGIRYSLVFWLEHSHFNKTNLL
jgi:predicted 2-oxoglutarate/Fe(II)-dependent dioxygenase YbiX